MQQHFDNTPSVFTRIYESDCNLACWQREQPPELTQYIEQLPGDRQLNLRIIQSLDNLPRALERQLPAGEGRQLLIDDICLIVDMFSCLFEQEEVGLRLAQLTGAMCPRFHVDHVPCRLVTTWQGPATQWLDNALADIPDLDSPDSWQQLNSSDVALMKGDGWYNNSGRGFVHRSPSVPAGQRRLFMSLDFTH